MSGRSRKALEPEVGEERRRGDIGVGRAGGRAARPGGDQAFAAQRGDRIARDLPAQKLRQLPPGDRLKIPDRHQDERVRARQFGFLRGPQRRPDRVAKAQFRAEHPAARDGDDLVGTAAQFVANIVDDRARGCRPCRRRAPGSPARPAQRRRRSPPRPGPSIRASAPAPSGLRARGRVRPRILRPRAIAQSP